MKTLDSKRVAFDIVVMGNTRRVIVRMNAVTVTQTARMPSTTTPHYGVVGVLVSLVCVLFHVSASQCLGRGILHVVELDTCPHGTAAF